MKPFIEQGLATNSRGDSHLDVSEVSKDRELIAVASIFFCSNQNKSRIDSWVALKETSGRWNLHMYVQPPPTRRFPLIFWVKVYIIHLQRYCHWRKKTVKVILNWICCCNTCHRNYKSCVPQLQEILARNARALGWGSFKGHFTTFNCLMLELCNLQTENFTKKGERRSLISLEFWCLCFTVVIAISAVQAAFL